MNRLLIDTDQNECYDTFGQKVPCEGSRQDGERRTVQSDGERFQVLSDTVSDNWTGLTWTRTACIPDGLCDFESASLLAEKLSAENAFRSPRRLPTRWELFSLISHQIINPALPHDHPFTDVSPVYYWTADSSARLHDEAWYIHLGGGRIYRGKKHGSYMVWPAIGPAPCQDPSLPSFFVDHTLVHDRLTGLIWLQDLEMTRAVKWHEAIEKGKSPPLCRV